MSESSPGLRLRVVVDSESTNIITEMKSVNDGDGSSHMVEPEAMEIVAVEAQVPPAPSIATRGMIAEFVADNGLPAGYMVQDPGF